jgi:outer membrane protein assembly factor BamB
MADMQSILFQRRARTWLAVFLAAVTFHLIPDSALAQQRGPMLAREQIARLGLVRAWFAQVQVDGSHSRVQRAILSGDQLFVLTNVGTLHAIHALTGETMWVATLGRPDFPSLGPAANDAQVAVLNGSTLHVLDRIDGRPIIVRRVGGAPGAAPAMSNNYCFVPMLMGRLEGYGVATETMPLWNYQALGRAMVPPLVTATSVVWSTDVGHIYFGNANAPGVRFRLETGSEIVASPAASGRMIYVGTVAGELIAADEMTGAQPWRFAAGFPIARSPAAIGGRVYVTSLRPALAAVDIVNGVAQWSSPTITQFAAASRERVYAIDNLRSLVVLDAASGAILQRMPTDGASTALVNDQTDRLYLVSERGLVQCLREIAAEQPLYHNPRPAATPAEVVPKTPADAMPATPATPTQPTTPAAEPDNPFGGPLGGAARQPTVPPAGPPGQPSGTPDDNPFGGLGGGSGGAEGNPFGGR